MDQMLDALNRLTGIWSAPTRTNRFLPAPASGEGPPPPRMPLGGRVELRDLDLDNLHPKLRNVRERVIGLHPEVILTGVKIGGNECIRDRCVPGLVEPESDLPLVKRHDRNGHQRPLARGGGKKN